LQHILSRGEDEIIRMKDDIAIASVALRVDSAIELIFDLTFSLVTGKLFCYTVCEDAGGFWYVVLLPAMMEKI